MKQEHFFLSCMCRYVHADTSSGTAHKDEWGLVIMSWPGFLELICHLLPSAFITAVIFCHDYQFLKPNFMMFHIFLITSFVTFVLRLKKCKLLLKWISYIWLEWSLVAVMVQCRCSLPMNTEEDLVLECPLSLSMLIHMLLLFMLPLYPC